MLVRVSGSILKLGKRWEIQQVVLACPAFRGQELKDKRPLWPNYPVMSTIIEQIVKNVQTVWAGVKAWVITGVTS